MNQPKEAQSLIYDGLLEASNYLCKLGSNLISRSTNLKHDKIVSTKLSTYLDIDIAVQKIKLICELSRKSLDNVENGVKYVLEEYENRWIMQSKNQAARKWYTFEFDNLVLKISKKIHISQYTSAQVLLKRLNQSIMNRYISDYNKIYVMKSGQKNIFGLLDASKKNRKASKSSLGNGNKRRRISSNNIEQNAGLNNKVEITNNSGCNMLKESENKMNATVTEKLFEAKSKAKSESKISLDVETSSNEKIETDDKSRRNSKEITKMSKDKIVKKRKSISEAQEGKEEGTLNDEIKDTNNLMENKKKSELLEQEDDETQKSLGKLTCTGGMENSRLKCVDINKLIDKAKALNCQLTFKSNKQKTDIKKKTNLSGFSKTTVVDTKSEINKKLDEDAKSKHRKKSDVVDKSESKNKSNFDAKSESKKKSDVNSKSESRKNFEVKSDIKKKTKEKRIDFIAKPFSIKIIRLHNNLQTYKHDFNIKKIFYQNEEIVSLIEGNTNSSDTYTDKSSQNNYKEQIEVAEDIEASTSSDINSAGKSEETNPNDTDRSSQNKNKEQIEVAKDIEASTSSDRNSAGKSAENNQDQITNILSTYPNHSQDVNSVMSSEDFELRYSDSPDEDAIVEQGLACLKEEVAYLEEQERQELEARKECAKNMLLKYSEDEEKPPKNVTRVNLCLVSDNYSSSDETVIVPLKTAKTSLRLIPRSPTSKRRSSQSSSSSSCSSTENAKIIKKVRFE